MHETADDGGWQPRPPDAAKFAEGGDVDAPELFNGIINISYLFFAIRNCVCNRFFIT